MVCPEDYFAKKMALYQITTTLCGYFGAFGRTGSDVKCRVFLNQALSAATSGGDVLNPFMKALNTVGSAFSGALNAQMTDIQYLSLSALYIGMILTTVWLLRQHLANRIVKVRDGVYSSIAPIISEYVLVL